jgi:IS4 transposase
VLTQPTERSKQKTDRRDAGELSHLLWVHRQQFLQGKHPFGLRRVQPPTAEEAHDRQLTALRAKLTRKRTAVLNGMGGTGKADARPDHSIRPVVVKTTPHEKRGSGPANNGQLLIATNLLDLPAWIIALIYRYRWTIEIFFRFFKHVLGCRHLLSHDPVGVEIQTYCAIIACMLISLWTGRKPTLRT